MENGNYNKEKVLDMFFAGPWYIHVNDLVTISVAKFGDRAFECIEPWFNREESIKEVAFMDMLFFPQHVKADFDKIFASFLEEIHKGNKVSIAKWQEETGGRSVLVANKEYFAITPIAMLLGINLDPQLGEIFEEGINKLKTEYPEDSLFCSQTSFLSSRSSLIQYACIQYTAMLRNFHTHFGATPEYLKSLSFNRFLSFDKLAQKYLV